MMHDIYASEKDTSIIITDNALRAMCTPVLQSQRLAPIFFTNNPAKWEKLMPIGANPEPETCPILL